MTTDRGGQPNPGPPISRPRAVMLIAGDDNERDALAEICRQTWDPAPRVETAKNAAEAHEALSNGPMDLIILDSGISPTEQKQILGYLSALESAPLTLFLTAEGAEDVAIEALRLGAHDYLTKTDFNGPSLRRALRRAATHYASNQHRRTLAQLQRSQAEMDHFVRALSHDMSANFMLLESSLGRLQKSPKVKTMPSLAQDFSHVHACLDQSKRFLDDLVALSKTGAVHMEASRVPLSPLVEQVLFEQRELLEERNTTATLDIRNTAVWCNENRVKQVFTNLLRNAALHGTPPEGGRIRIWACSDKDRRFVRIRIEDNGPGIPAAYRDEIFLPGRRAPNTTSDGTGMGLAIVRRVIQHYGGDITIDADFHTGTAFEFTLPRASRQHARTTQNKDSRA